MDTFALSPSDEMPEVHADELSLLPTSKLGAVIACGLTLSRAPLGAAAGWLLIEGRFSSAVRVYAVGIATDVLDGFIARTLNGESAWGKTYDGVIDTVFYWLATVGYVLGGLRRGDSVLRATAPLLLVVATLGITFWFEPYSEYYKYRSLINRSWVLLLMLAWVPWSEADVVAAVSLGLMALIGVVYEWRNTQREIAGGLRGRGWQRPNTMTPLPSYHRVLVRLQGTLRDRRRRAAGRI